MTADTAFHKGTTCRSSQGQTGLWLRLARAKIAAYSAEFQRNQQVKPKNIGKTTQLDEGIHSIGGLWMEAFRTRLFNK